MTRSQLGITEIGYNAFDAKNNGMVIAWPMPINRSEPSVTSER